MSVFRIHKTDDVDAGVWYLDYPEGFSDVSAGETWDTFDEAVAAFIAAQRRWCLMGCGKGSVIDTPTGWECTSCGASDIAAAL